MDETVQKACNSCINKLIKWNVSLKAIQERANNAGINFINTKEN